MAGEAEVYLLAGWMWYNRVRGLCEMLQYQRAPQYSMQGGECRGIDAM